jgi:asparagine synthase (glutamine-hydrolysing)
MELIAAHGYRIAVSGTAADELFTGYFDHHLAYLYEIRDDRELSKSAREAWLQVVKPFVRNPYLQNPDLFFENPAMRDHIFFGADGFARYLKTAWSEPFAEQCYSQNLLRSRMLNELFHETVPVILHEDDLNAMYFSIENRSPYLDRPLFDFCNRIPTRHLVHEGFAKSVLREAMEGIVPPRALWERRKVGFNASLHSLLDLEDPCVREWILDDGPIYQHVRRPLIEAELAKRELSNSRSKFLFYFLASKAFLEEVTS